MVLPSLADALLVVVLLIPGFIGFYLFRRLGLSNKPLSEFEVTVWSFFFSAMILFFFTALTGLSDIDAIRDRFFEPLYFGLLFAVTAGVGIGCGFILRRIRADRTLEDPWQYAMKLHQKYTVSHLSEQGKNLITVFTNDDKYFRGYLYHASEDNGGILIKNPGIKNLNEHVDDNEWEILFIKEDDIKRVIFRSDFPEH